MAQKKKEGATKRTFRFDDDLIRRVGEQAEQEKRTITAQIEVLLEKALKDQGRMPATR